MMNKEVTKRGRFRHLFMSEDNDPMQGIANLFDVAMVLVLALLIASYAQSSVSVVEKSQIKLTESQNNKAKNETLPQNKESLQHYRMSEKTLRGDGERLGIAYRLSNGEVVFVPEAK